MKYKVHVELKYMIITQKIRMGSMQSILHAYIFQEMAKKKVLIHSRFLLSLVCML